MKRKTSALNVYYLLLNRIHSVRVFAKLKFSYLGIKFENLGHFYNFQIYSVHPSHSRVITSAFSNLKPVTWISSRSLDTDGHRSSLFQLVATNTWEVYNWHLTGPYYASKWKVSIYINVLYRIARAPPTTVKEYTLFSISRDRSVGRSVGTPVNVSVITDGRDKSRSTSSFRIETLWKLKKWERQLRKRIREILPRQDVKYYWKIPPQW